MIEEDNREKSREEGEENWESGKDDEIILYMKDIKRIAQNLGKTGMSAKKISGELIPVIIKMQPIKDRWTASLLQKPEGSNLDGPKWKCRIILGRSF